MNLHPNKPLERRFVLSLGLTIFILIAEVVGGLLTGSLALLSDAAHVFMDAFALGLSYLALRLSSRPADDRYTYGYHRLEVLAALVNGILLGAIALAIFGEAWKRWQNPEPIHSLGMLVVAVVGLGVNLVVAWLLHEPLHEPSHPRESGTGKGHSTGDLNVRSAYLHVVGDAISSIGVILAAGLIGVTGWLWIDPLVSLLIGLFLVLGSGRVLKSSLHILIEGVPEHLSLEKIRQSMEDVPGVEEIHDLHVWSLCSGHVALSAHIVITDRSLAEGGAIMEHLKHRLSGFGIEHTTIQFECAACGQEERVLHPRGKKTGQAPLTPAS